MHKETLIGGWRHHTVIVNEAGQPLLAKLSVFVLLAPAANGTDETFWTFVAGNTLANV